MKKWWHGLLTICLLLLLAVPVSAALPGGTGIVTSLDAVSGREFSAKSSVANKLDKMFAGDIGLYKDRKKTKLVNAALGTRNVPNNGVNQYWGKRAGTSCFAYANAFYATFYDGTYPHGSLNGNHQKIKATGAISYKNLVAWGVRDDAAVYVRVGSHSIIILQYDESYITYVDGNGDGKGLIAIRKEAWKRGSGSNIYRKPSLIVQPKESYFAAGSMGKHRPVPCTDGGTYHDWDEGVIVQAPTCLEKGQKVYTCLGCQKTKEEAIAKTKDHTYGEWETSREATCSYGGKEVSTCSLCGETKIQSTSLLAHKYGKWTVTKEATCTAEGKKEVACTGCGKKKTQALKVLGHAYSKAETVQKATIYSCGVKEKICTRCQKIKKIKTPCTYRNKSLDMTLTTTETVFPKNTRITVDLLEETEEIQSMLQEITGKFAVYALSADAKEVSVEAKGQVTMELGVPETFGENLALYWVNGEEVERLEASMEAGILTVELEQLGVFALCDLGVPYVPAPTETVPTTTQPATEPTQTIATEAVRQLETPAPQENGYILPIGISGAVIAVILVGLFCWRKVKKEKKEEISVN